MDVSPLPDPEMHPAWADIERLLATAANDTAPYDPALDVVWIAYDGAIWGAATTRLRADEPTVELLCVAGRRFREWIGPMEAEMCAWGRLCGARRFVSRGRIGWARFAARFGWAPCGTDKSGKALFFKEL